VVAPPVSALVQLGPVLVSLALHVFGLSLIAFGGVSTVLPEIHRLAVDQEHWMTDRDFANLFALSSIAPGPNFLVITLVGYKAAGVAGAAVATFALCAPTSYLTYVVMKGWNRVQLHWRTIVREGLVPVTVGFIAVSATLLVHASDSKPLHYAISAVTVLVSMLTKFHPLWVFAGAAVLGAFGFL
jgi:chromate transporter